MFRHFAAVFLLLTATFASRPALAAGESQIRDLETIELFMVPAVDSEEIRLADERRAANGRVPHYAVGVEVGIDPWSYGDWQRVGKDEARWRLRITSPGALSLNLAFGRYRMPPGGRLMLLSADGRYRVGPFSADDNESHGQLWTPPIVTDDLVLELSVPIDELEDLELELTRVFHGYAGFGESPPKSGDCHRDVACPLAEPWSRQARSVALISVSGNRFCTGFLVNNTALDGRPFFLTASHCGVTSHNAASVVVMWNHERSVCGEEEPAPEIDPRQFQTGAIFRAAYQPSDTVLLELDDMPAPGFRVYYAGWDRSLADPSRSAVIHHPNTDVKRISLDFNRATTTSHLDDQPVAGGDHIRVGSWDMGSTEGGSSGAPLFNQEKLVVGQLHGGYAACGASRADWFGRLSAAWTGGGRPGSRLSDWLDPSDAGVPSLPGIDATEIEGGPPVLGQSTDSGE